MKKLLSLVLAFALVLTCGAFCASAEGDYIQLTWAMGSGGPAPTDNAMVLEAANKISREKIGVELTIDYLSGDEMALSIQSGEVYDIYFTCSWMNETNKAISQGLFLGLTQEEIEETAPGLYNAMSKVVWDLAESADGYIYAIPNKKDYAAENFMTYPADYAAQLGYEIPAAVASWDEMTEFLTAWKNEICSDNEYPVMIGGSPAGIDTSFDYISRSAMIGVTYGSTEVITIFDDPDFADRLEVVAKWYAEGLINPDCATLTENAIDSHKEHIGFAQAWEGYDYSVGNGYNTAMTRFSGPVLNVDAIQGSMNAFSATLAGNDEKIEACLKLFELIHTDKLYCDTLRFGVQGYHWDYVTEGPCAGGVLKTQAGKDNYGPWGFSQPAYFFASIEVSQDQIDGTVKAPVLDQYEQYYAVVAENAIASAMGGFKWDSSASEDKLKELSNIREEYWARITTGTSAFADVKDEMMDKLYAAGLQDVIDDAQAQLDAYLGK